VRIYSEDGISAAYLPDDGTRTELRLPIFSPPPCSGKVRGLDRAGTRWSLNGGYGLRKRCVKNGTRLELRWPISESLSLAAMTAMDQRTATYESVMREDG
jgi:hypothetical protein